MPKDRSAQISLYRVWKNETTDNASQVAQFNNLNGNNENLNKDLGFDDLMIIQESRIIEHLQDIIQNQKTKIQDSELSFAKKEKIINQLTSQISSLFLQIDSVEDRIAEYEKISVFIEDEYTQLYKIAYLKLNDIDCNLDNYEELFMKNAPFVIFPKCGCIELKKFLDQTRIDEFKDKKVIGLFDFDDAYNQFNGLNAQRWNAIDGDIKMGLYRKRNDSDNVYAMLIPVPENRSSYASIELAHNSALEIELLFSDDALRQIDAFAQQQIPRTNTMETILKGEKKDFWKKTFALNKIDFINFEPLFNSIKNLFSE